jgi:hypothetical protein
MQFVFIDRQDGDVSFKCDGFLAHPSAMKTLI